MKRITVYADFDFLSNPQEIGVLGYEHVRGKDHFVFEYSREWLKQYGGLLFSGDLMNVPSAQHPRSNDNVFGFVKDSFPDRWGRLLLDRRERLIAREERRPILFQRRSAGTVPLVANLLSHSGLLKILGANGAEDYLYLVAVQDVIDQYEFSAMDHSDCMPIQLSV